MNALLRLAELLQTTRQSVANMERLIKEHPDQIGFLIELKSLRKLLAQLEEESVTVTARLVGVDTVKRSFRLEVEEGTIVEGRLADTVNREYPLQVPHRYRAELKTVRRVASRSGKDLTRYILSDLTPVD